MILKCERSISNMDVGDRQTQTCGKAPSAGRRPRLQRSLPACFKFHPRFNLPIETLEAEVARGRSNSRRGDRGSSQERSRKLCQGSHLPNLRNADLSLQSSAPSYL